VSGVSQESSQRGIGFRDVLRRTRSKLVITHLILSFGEFGNREARCDLGSKKIYQIFVGATLQLR